MPLFRTSDCLRYSLKARVVILLLFLSLSRKRIFGTWAYESKHKLGCQWGWQDYSSDSYNNPRGNAKASSYSPFHVSEDEYEERILAALANLSYDGEEENTREASLDHNGSVRMTRKQQSSTQRSANDKRPQNGKAVLLERESSKVQSIKRSTHGRSSHASKLERANIQAANETRINDIKPQCLEPKEANATRRIQATGSFSPPDAQEFISRLDQESSAKMLASQQRAFTRLETISSHPNADIAPHCSESLTNNIHSQSRGSPLNSIDNRPSVSERKQQQSSIRANTPYQVLPQPGPRAESNVNAPQQQYPRTTTTMDNSITPWVKKFLTSRSKDTLLPIPRDYLLDNFNLVRLAPVVERIASIKQQELEAPTSPNLEAKANSQKPTTNHRNHPYALYREALDLILRQEDVQEDPPPTVQFAAEVLYCLVHARFAVSPRGLDVIRRRLVFHASAHHGTDSSLFGRCPKLSCAGMPLLPCGISDDYDCSGDAVNYSNSRAKRYCCRCQETFHCWDSKTDGSAWGTSVCHLLLMVYGKEVLFPSHFAAPFTVGKEHSSAAWKGEEPVNCYGYIFGFPVHPSVAFS